MIGGFYKMVWMKKVWRLQGRVGWWILFLNIKYYLKESFQFCWTSCCVGRSWSSWWCCCDGWVCWFLCMMGIHTWIVPKSTVPLFTVVSDSANCCIDFLSKMFHWLRGSQKQYCICNLVQGVEAVLCHLSTVVMYK